MKKQYFLIALICLVLPILARGLWFYQGIYLHNPFNQAPDYGDLLIPQPTISTQAAPDPIKSFQKKTVLVDFAHTNRFSLSEIDALTQTFLQMGANLQIDKDGKDLPGKLQDADAYIIIAPTVPFTRENIQSIHDFVTRGGHLLVIADPTRTYQNYYFDMEDSVLIANQIIDPFEIAFKTDYVYSITHNEGNYRNVYAIPAGENRITNGINNVVFYGAHPLSGNFIPLLNVDNTTLSSGTDQGGDLVIAAISEDGKVLIIGDMGFIVTPYNQVTDNYQLVINTAKFLAGEARQRSIADFPNLFTRPLIILENSDVLIDKNILTELASLQVNFQTHGIDSAVSDQPEDGKDLLILGTYPPSEEMANWMATAGFRYNGPMTANGILIEPTPSSTETTKIPSSPSFSIEYLNDFYTIPGIGAIPSKGFNFLFYDQGEKRNILILLAESRRNIVDLLKLINKGSLKDCILQTNIAVCPGGIVLKDTPSPFLTTQTPAPITTTTVTPTPTSVG